MPWFLVIAFCKTIWKWKCVKDSKHPDSKHPGNINFLFYWKSNLDSKHLYSKSSSGFNIIFRHFFHPTLLYFDSSLFQQMGVIPVDLEFGKVFLQLFSSYNCYFFPTRLYSDSLLHWQLFIPTLFFTFLCHSLFT